MESLTIKEVAQYLKVAEKTIYRLVSAKEIPAFKVGGSWRFKLSEIDKWASSGGVVKEKNKQDYVKWEKLKMDNQSRQK